MAFMRMRSPSSAPPLLRRLGSMADHGDAQRVALVQAQAADELVGEAALAGAAGAGDAEHGDLLRRRGSGQRGLEGGVGAAVLERGDGLRQLSPGGFGVALQDGHVGGGMGCQVDVAAHDHLADHAGRPMRWPSSGL
jgi:hypothetical protein